MEEKNKNLINTFISAGILIFIMAGVPILVGLGKGGFLLEEIRTMFFFYAIIGAIFLIGIVILTFVEYYTKKGDNVYGDSLLFHNPGEIPAVKSNFFKNTIGIALLAIILSSLLGLYSIYTQTQFTEIGRLEQQQFTKTDNMIYSGGLIPASENLLVAFFAALYLVLLRVWSRKNNINKGLFLTLSWIGVILIFVISGIINHLSRYGGSDIALTNVGLFWFFGSILTLISGSFIAFWVFHINNNLFLELTKTFSNEVILIGTVFVIVILIFMFLLLTVKRKKVGV